MEKGATEDEMVLASLTRWTEFEQTPGDSGEQGNLVCCSPRGHSEMRPDELRTEQQQREDIKCARRYQSASVFLFFFSVHTITFFCRSVDRIFFVGLAQDSFSDSEGYDFVCSTTIYSNN